MTDILEVPFQSLKSTVSRNCSLASLQQSSCQVYEKDLRLQKYKKQLDTEPYCLIATKPKYMHLILERKESS